MALITIQILEGLERGAVYDRLPTPLTIGREDENRIRLNDERVSRFHAKIQEDNGRVILTDLDSTNGTRVNGQPIQMRVLQPGDQLSIGRCLLLYGSREQIADRMRSLAASSPGLPHDPADGTCLNPPGEEFALEDEPFATESPFATGLFPAGIPQLPQGLRPAQQAELSDLIAYVHDQIQNVMQAACELRPTGEAESPNGRRTEGMFLSWLAWQRLLVLEADLAVALRRAADPDFG